MLFVSPGIVTLGWHLFHGNTIETRGKKLLVPLAWIAETDDARDVFMMKLPLSLVHGVRFDGLISVGQNFFQPAKKTEEIYRSFETGYWTLAGTDVVVMGPTRSGSGANETFCMQSSHVEGRHLVSVSCLVLQGKWQAHFHGDRNDVEPFFEIIGKIN